MEPFEFEMNIYKNFQKKKNYKILSPFNPVIVILFNIWEILNKTKTYPYLIKPLKIKF